MKRSFALVIVVVGKKSYISHLAQDTMRNLEELLLVGEFAQIMNNRLIGLADDVELKVLDLEQVLDGVDVDVVQGSEDRRQSLLVLMVHVRPRLDEELEVLLVEILLIGSDLLHLFQVHVGVDFFGGQSQVIVGTKVVEGCKSFGISDVRVSLLVHQKE